MSTCEASVKTAGEACIPEDVEILVVLRRPHPDGTVNVVGFEPEASRAAIFEEYRGVARGIAAEFYAAEGADLDEEDLDGGVDGE